MFILKDILYGIKTRKNSAVLTVIQLTFTLFISYSILNIYFDGAIVNSSNRWALNDIEEIYLINAKDDSIVRRDNDLYIELVEKINEEETEKFVCPECGNESIIPTCGCGICLQCGYSKCN